MSSDAFDYGPSSQLKIDTTQSYRVKTRFFSDMDKNGKKTDLTRI